MERQRIGCEWEHVVTYTGLLAGVPEVIGTLAEGFRIHFYSAGGEFSGPRLRGKVREVGGDWVTVRRDGIGILDVRTTFETEDGALILVTYAGTMDLGEDGYEKFSRGELPATVRLRTSPIFRTAHPDYAWLNRLHCVGLGEYSAASNSATYDVYAVR